MWRFVNVFLIISLTLLRGSIIKDHVRIGLAIDEYSLSDALLLINSIIETCYHPELLQFYVLACGKDDRTAIALRDEVESSFNFYFNGIVLHIEPFFLPIESGFYRQLAVSKKQKHHWNSPIGADMARFFLPSVFSNISKLLYLDNDIIVTCCIEEIYRSQLNDSDVIGIALDDLQWATVTQFQRHYNASHPLMLKYMRQDSALGFSPVSNEEFIKAVPKYPNDGVILFNVPIYNSLNILSEMNEIAYHNSLPHEHVVNMGTQQFTVLTLHNRWKELSTRSNLRHFPTMARGFLMWYYFHGILHYAGMAKPKVLCQYDSYKDHNWLRVQSYLPWLINNFHMMHKATLNNNSLPSSLEQLGYIAIPRINNIATVPQRNFKTHQDNCFQHILLPYDFYHFLIILKSLMNSTYNEESSSNVVVHIGPFSSIDDLNKTFSTDPFLQIFKEMSSVPIIAEEISSLQSTFLSINAKWEMECSRKALLEKLLSRSGTFTKHNLIHVLNYFIASDSNWNSYSFADQDNVYEQVSTLQKLTPSEVLNSRVRGYTLSSSKQRETHLSIANLFESIFSHNAHFKKIKTFSKNKKKLDINRRPREFKVNFEPLCYKEQPDDENFLDREAVIGETIDCVDVLSYIKTQKYKHWDIIGLIIDKKSVLDTIYIINGLDMLFIRPKFILVHIEEKLDSTLKYGISYVQKFLNRNGFNHANYADYTSASEYHGWIWGSRVSLLEFA